METAYIPVAYDYREVIEEQIAKKTRGKIFFFDQDQKVDSCEGQVMAMTEVPAKGMFITLDSGARLRIDRIITLFGKPGAAFDEYDAFSNQCLSCTGGYPL